MLYDRQSADCEHQAAPETHSWDHCSHDSFYQYYAKKSGTSGEHQRFREIQNAILRVLGKHRPLNGSVLQVADIGCAAGTQSMVWAESGHVVHGVEINEPLLELGRQRAAAAGYTIDFQLGSATELPWADGSIDVCIALELLEHVADWKRCLNEFTRVLRSRGAMLVTTTNGLYPFQAEFNLPFYSWYPRPVKRYYERLASTTRPDLANFAKYPAVHWFTFSGLQRHLSPAGFLCFDRFDMMDVDRKGDGARIMVSALRSVRPLRWLARACTPSTILLAIKAGE